MRIRSVTAVINGTMVVKDSDSRLLTLEGV
jgi:hypothetical protein